MPRLHFFCIGFIFLVVLSGCLNSDKAVSGMGGAASDARALLTAFDKSNPACQLWTNWETMCSRTGPQGETICVADPNRPVAPSAPFCAEPFSANPAVIGYDAAFLNQDQTASVLRFCDQVVNTEMPFMTGDERVMIPIRICRKFQADRPFNGYRVAARRHVWCDEWSDAASENVVCSELEEGDGEAQRCDSLASSGYEHPSRLYCSSWNLPHWCQAARSFYDYVSSSGRPAPTDDAQDFNDAIYFGSQPPAAAPIYGVMCAAPRE